MGENETETVFVLTKREHRRLRRNEKAITGMFQHALVIADVEKKKIRKVVRRICAERREISLLKDVKIR